MNTDEGREALRKLIAAEHRLHAQMRQQEQLVERWHARAELASRRGENQLAREALARKTEHERRARDLRTQYLEHTAAVGSAKLRLSAPMIAPAAPTRLPSSQIDAKLDRLA